jgi:O-antigen ligase
MFMMGAITCSEAQGDEVQSSSLPGPGQRWVLRDLLIVLPGVMILVATGTRARAAVKSHCLQ